MGGKSGIVKPGSVPVAFPFPPGKLLSEGLASLGLPPEDICGFAADGAVLQSVRIRGIGSVIPLINRYMKELELFNAVFDLVGAETGNEQGRSDLVVRHILDSLSPWKEIQGTLDAITVTAQRMPDMPARRLEVADAGSGAGFPGIPLAIVFPEISFTLVERMSKRCAFLENCAAILGLKNITVLNVEVEKAPASAFDLVVFRAFRPLDREMIRTLLRLPRAGGKLAAWKARKDKIEEEMAAIAGEIHTYEVLPLQVPFLGHEERHLVLID